MPAAGGRTDQGYLNRLATTRLPQVITGDIFKKAEDKSIMLQLGRRIPVSMYQNVLTTPDTFPEAGQVGGTSLESREGAEKPIQGLGYGTTKTFSPIKLAVIVTVSNEYAALNVENLYGQISGELSGAIARAADLAVFHGRDAITGNALVGITNNSYINATTNESTIDFADVAAPNDVIEQIIEGVELVENETDKNYEVSAFAADKSFRTKLARLRLGDTYGSPMFGNQFPGSGAQINLTTGPGSLMGLPIVYGRSVRGKLGAYAGSTARMFAGDWSQVAWGFADDITLRISDNATVGGVSMFQTNQIAILCEATFGWIVNDPEAFTRYLVA